MKEKRILLLIIYNKRLQFKLEKSLINYKRYSKQYIIYESPNKGKVYNAYDDCIIFEGEYLNRKRNGKGIEYYNNGKKKFEGEYLNGKRHGEGIEYNENGNINYIGEYLNGERWKAKFDIYVKGNKATIEYVNGQIWNFKYYDNRNKIISEIKEGKGYRKFFYNYTLRFEGGYLNGKKNGIFKQYDCNGHLEYEIEYIFDKLWNVKKYDKNGGFKYILINGKGFMEEFIFEYETMHKIYEGEYLNGERNGK